MLMFFLHGDWKVRNLAADILYHPYKAHLLFAAKLFLEMGNVANEQVMIGNRDELKGNQDLCDVLDVRWESRNLALGWQGFGDLLTCRTSSSR